MPTNGYQTALEHATHEISEINAQVIAIHLQLEKLAQRKNLVEKLVEMLKQVDPPSDPVETPAVAAEAEATESPVSEAQAAEAPAPEAAPDEAQAPEVPEPEVVAYVIAAAVPYSNGAAVFEAPVPEAPEVEELDEDAESETPPAAVMGAAAAKRNGHSISRDLVAQLAHHFWTERGYGHGHHEQDWLRAEFVLSEAAP
jgi:hypothetical protein